MTRIVLTAILFVSAFIVTQNECLAIDGVEKAEIKVNGVVYTFPVGDMERKSDIYYLKKYLDEGDKTALSMFLGTQPTRMFYIGDDEPLWLLVSEEKVQVKGV